ncbi:MAG TPA: ATP phosphoribosyltransferase regulatory subunit, partial [Chitinophagaceae bacterium]|nr:ATP phosphoribosyltransferase regulatory subunit [Chitinophagaceae bacterium]
VWRADRPQKGRYREFYQCDADVVGSTALLNELELANIYKDVFEQLRIPVEIRINSRKILAALAKTINAEDKLTDITVAIDKLDKIGIIKVEEELAARGLNNEQITTISQYLSVSRIEQLSPIIGNNEGIEEINYIAQRFTGTNNTSLIPDFTLARGLNYYTGIIFEVKAKNVQMGSIGGGGRYDDLTGLFGVPHVPGVGISFGVDRIYDVMEELNLFPSAVEQGTKVLFFNLGDNESITAYRLLQQLRANGIAAEIYHENTKMDKQFKYAEKRKIPFIVIIGSRELEQGMAVVKNLQTGEQQPVSQENLPSFFS